MKKSISVVNAFTNSNHNSEEEKSFLDNTLNAYYQEKTKRRYSEILQEDMNIEPGSAADFQDAKNTRWSYKRIISMVIGIAAIIVASFFIFKSLNESSANDSQQLYASYIGSKIEMAGATRGEISEEMQAVQAMNTSYEEGRYSEVIANFEKLPSNSELTVVSRVQLAFSYGATQQSEKSVELFKNLLAESSSNMQQEIRWTLINLLLANNQKEKANEIFNQMKISDYKYSESKSLLGK